MPTRINPVFPTENQDPWYIPANTALATITAGVNNSAQTAPALTQWRAQAANRLYGLVNVVCIGSSTTEGFNATALPRRYVNRLGTLLHSSLSVPGVVGGYHVGAADTGWTLGGTSALDGNGLGLQSRVLQAAATMSRTETNCTSVEVYFQQGPGAGAFTVTVDAGSPVTVTPNTTGTANRGDGVYSSPPLAAGSHTFLITATAATAINGIYVRNGDETTGIRVFQSGRSGSITSDWSGASRTLMQRLAQLNPPLVTIMLGSNDFNTSINPITFQTALQSLVNQIKAAVTPTPSILIVGTYRRMDSTPTYSWDLYLAAMAAVAAADPANVEYINISAPYPTSPQLNASTLVIDTDLIHQTDKGHALMGDLLAAAITSPAPDTPVPATFTPPKVGNLLAWWRADALALADTTPVASWPVAGGLENATLTQATTGFQPVFRTNQVGGLPAVLFTAASTQSLDSGGWSATRPVPKTTFIVFKFNTGNIGNLFTGRAGVYCYAGAGTGVLQIGAGAVGELNQSVTFDTWHVAGMVYNGASSFVYLNSRTATAGGTTGTGVNSAFPGIRFGTNSNANGVWLDGAFAEFAAYDRALNGQEVAAMMLYLGAKYGITIA